MVKSNKIYFLLIFFATIFIGCQPSTNKPDIEKALSDLTNKFSQLPKSKSKQSDFYKLTRTVIVADKNIELQLRSTPDSIKDFQQVIIIINPKGQYYAIPFFSNTYRDYWSFEFDSPIPSIKKTNTTFQKEFINAIETLNLDDTLGTGTQIFFELLNSLLHCRILTENDSSVFEISPSPKNRNDLPPEEYDSCQIRYRKNFEAVKKEMLLDESFRYYLSYWDRYNSRVYQLSPQIILKRRQKLNFQMKVFRQDCVVHERETY